MKLGSLLSTLLWGMGFLVAAWLLLQLGLHIFWPALRWLTIDSSFFSLEASSCFFIDPVTGEKESIAGACYPAIWDTMPLLLMGRYPVSESWRIFLSLFFVVLSVVFLLKKTTLRDGFKKLTCKGGFFIFGLALAYLVFRGASGTPLEVIESSRWGGFILTLILSVIGIGFGFPLGLLLALARSSSLPVLKFAAVLFIEVIRGVPLITLLFLANYLFPLFLPTGSASISELLRAQVAIILFAGAYLAEVVRGGLAAVDRGQIEAAHALGMNYFLTMRDIVLPQALRVSAPALVSTFIGLIKDTSLVAVVGLFDLLGSARNVPSIPQWIGRDLEPLVFAGAVYFIICTGLARLAQKFEKA